MPKFYVTFGQSHVHKVEGKTLNKDTVARFDAESYAEGRKKAFEYFGPTWCFCYFDNDWSDKNMRYFPAGYVDLP